MGTNPLLDFLKYAETTTVKSHTRTEGGKEITVRSYSRVEDSPVELGEALQVMDTKKANELVMWKAWKDSGEDPELLTPLLKSFNPLIQSRANVYKGRLRMVPDSAIELEFQLRFVDALRTYDPSKGSLGTYIYRYLDKAKRFIVENQNIGRIPENRIYKIKQYTVARDDLQEDLGRVPTDEELAKKLHWEVDEIKRMDSELRSDFLTQGFETDPYVLTPSKSEEVLRLFKYELDGDERTVYEHLTGYGKKKLDSTGAIAAELKMPDYQVSRIKNSINKKLHRYLYE